MLATSAREGGEAGETTLPNSQFMHLFHISQVVFIIPRIRPGDKQPALLLIVFPFCREGLYFL